MNVEIKDYCIRCGMCEDLYPELFKLNIVDDKIDVKYAQVPEELEQKAKDAARDCAIAAIQLKK
ncbi:MAG: ferredoxin [Peptococcaceae bacterium]|nr:ferredoxin [Peptococcaceae bacterium]